MNKSKTKKPYWFFASNEKEARRLFFESGRVKSIENIKSVEDKTEFYLKIPKFAGSTERAIQSGLKGEFIMDPDKYTWSHLQKE
jgi:hypothetical protein